MSDIPIVHQFENMIINVFGMYFDFIILHVSTIMEVPLLGLQIGPCLKCRCHQHQYNKVMCPCVNPHKIESTCTKSKSKTHPSVTFSKYVLCDLFRIDWYRKNHTYFSICLKVKDRIRTRGSNTSLNHAFLEFLRINKKSDLALRKSCSKQPVLFKINWLLNPFLVSTH